MAFGAKGDYTGSKGIWWALVGFAVLSKIRPDLVISYIISGFR
jgi:hypothetical protein